MDVVQRAATPIWQLLPEDARAAATKLVAQLLTDRERAARKQHPAGERGDV